MTWLWILPLVACQAQSGNTSEATGIREADSIYTYGEGSYDGIGKFYMGREISHVMGHMGASWLERAEREEEEKVSLVIQNLKQDVAKNAVVADIGAGTGYYSFKIARLVPEGKVLAVDIQPEMLAIIKEKMGQSNVTNIETIRGEIENPNLPKGAVDFVIFVDVYHELSHPREMMTHIYEALKPSGKVLLLEYRKEDPNVPIKPLHKMTADQAIKEMKAVGLSFVENRDILPWQHYLLFKK